MRLRSLGLTNFRQHASSRLEFGTGITGIIGRNGVGKSTVLEAIAWALYGQPAARGTKESIKYQRAPARAGVKVELEFDLAGHRYRVVRSLVSADLYLDGAFEPIASSLSAVTDVLQRTLGMTRQEFFQTYFTGQKDLAVMAAMGPAERAHFLTRVLGYDQLRVAQEFLRDRRRELTSELAGIRQALPDPAAVHRAGGDAAMAHRHAARAVTSSGQALADANAALALVGPRWVEAQRLRDEHTRLTNEVKLAEREFSMRERSLAELEEDLEALAGARRDLVPLQEALAPWEELQREHVALEALSQAATRRRLLEDTIVDLEAEISQLEPRAFKPDVDMVEQLTLELERTRAFERDLTTSLESARSTWTEARQAAIASRDAFRTQYKELKAQRDRVASLGADGACPTCTRVMGENLALVLAQLDEQLSTVERDGQDAAARVARVDAKPAEIFRAEQNIELQRRELADLERRVSLERSAAQVRVQAERDIWARNSRLVSLRAELGALPQGFDAARFAALREEIDALTRVRSRVTALQVQLEREPSLRERHTESHDAVQALQRRIGGLATDREQLRFDEPSFALVRESYESATVDVRAAELALATAIAELRGAERAEFTAVAAVAELERTQAQEATIARDTRLHHELDRIYGGLRTELNERLRPELSAIASEYLAALTEGRYAELELDAQFNIVVLEDGRPKPVISGGEEDLTNIALRLAISQMIAERNGHRFSLLILDEIFGALDEQRQANVIDLLRSLEARFEQIILITHLPVVRGQAHEILLDYDASAGCTVVRSVA